MERNTDWSAALFDLQKAMATRRKAELDVIAAARGMAGILPLHGLSQRIYEAHGKLLVALHALDSLNAEGEATDGK